MSILSLKTKGNVCHISCCVHSLFHLFAHNIQLPTLVTFDIDIIGILYYCLTLQMY